MSMTREERFAKNEILRILSENGYPTYANLLDDFDINLTEDPGVVGYMEPSKGKIVLNRGLDIEQVSTIVRHEILHEYLRHEQRLLQELARKLKPDVKYDDLDDLSIKELKNKLYSNKDFNIAADYEISNRGYTDKDKEIIRGIKLNGQVLTGLVTEDQHPGWVDMSVEEMYDELQKLRKKDSEMEPEEEEEEEVIYGDFLDDETFVDEDGNVWGTGDNDVGDMIKDVFSKIKEVLNDPNFPKEVKEKMIKDFKEQAIERGIPEEMIDQLLN